MNVHDQNGSEMVIVFVPTDIFANKPSEVFRCMVQPYLTNLWDNLELWKDMQRWIPEPLHGS